MRLMVKEHAASGKAEGNEGRRQGNHGRSHRPNPSSPPAKNRPTGGGGRKRSRGPRRGSKFMQVVVRQEEEKGKAKVYGTRIRNRDSLISAIFYMY